MQSVMLVTFMYRARVVQGTRCFALVHPNCLNNYKIHESGFEIMLLYVTIIIDDSIDCNKSPQKVTLHVFKHELTVSE